MADQPSVMKEFRLLDEKLRTVGLTKAEEARWAGLRDLVAPGAEPLKPGFDVNAAAADLLASLEPAGLRRPSEPTAPSGTEEGILDLDAEPGSSWLQPSMSEAPSDPSLPVAAAGPPQDAAPLDAQQQDWSADDFAARNAAFQEVTEDLGPQTSDADAQSWDSSPQAGEPNAQPWDPNQAWDPNAQAGDPNAQTWDPNQAWDPSAQGGDPNTLAWDPNAQAWVSNAQAGDPNVQAWDPNAQAYPNAQVWDPNAQIGDPNLQAWDPNAQAWVSNAQAGDPNPQTWDPNAQAWVSNAQAGDPNVQAWDPSAQAWDPNAQVWNTSAEPNAPSYEPSAPSGDPAVPAAEPPYDALRAAGVEGVSPDASAISEAQAGDSAALGWEGGAAAPPADGLKEDLLAGDWLGGPPPQVADLDHDLIGEAPIGPAFGSSEPSQPPFPEGLDLGKEHEPAAAEKPQGSGPLPPLGDWATEVSVLEDDSAPGTRKGTSRFDLASGGSFAASLPSVEVPFDDEPKLPKSQPPIPEPESDVVDLADIVLEEIEPGQILDATEPEVEEQVPVAVMHAAPPVLTGEQYGGASPSFIAGSHRVVVHTVEGQVKRGTLSNADLDVAQIALGAQSAGASEVIPTSRIKAIFFMLPPGETPPAPEGRKVRVTFKDGRQVAGFSEDYAPEQVGFFMVPADTRTNTARIWVYRDAVRQVSVS